MSGFPNRLDRVEKQIGAARGEVDELLAAFDQLNETLAKIQRADEQRARLYGAVPAGKPNGGMHG